jgi:DNA-binding NarL/FixJ family response regulator
MSRQDIADYLCLRIETVSRMLSQLAVIAVAGSKRIMLRKRQKNMRKTSSPVQATAEPVRRPRACVLAVRPPCSHQRQEAVQRLANGEAQADIARSYAVSQSTISRLAPSIRK